VFNPGKRNQWTENDILNLLVFSRTLPVDNRQSGFFSKRMSWMASEYDDRGFGPSAD